MILSILKSEKNSSVQTGQLKKTTLKQQILKNTIRFANRSFCQGPVPLPSRSFR